MQVGEPFSPVTEMLNPEIVPEKLRASAAREYMISGPHSHFSPAACKLMRKLSRALMAMSKHKDEFNVVVQQFHALGYTHIPDMLGIMGCYEHGQEGGTFTLTLP